ncbi:lipopolysaccharide biosynthesis protein [Streptomyces sp. MI02-7b]|uniref:lipopolysaccharide biosynthesis protein n=1 Tax=Streptomyces sp. MI02-7b TaxID=462941 RepID=UPI0029AA30F1|nr:lipopolysaccharide biosynthesis protein [Streptomyces sp. MI02-7b]MDX3075037.1 lipopolysaccharide biosynthesis protein [Streptomyces sp. MI02-7b]
MSETTTTSTTPTTPGEPAPGTAAGTATAGDPGTASGTAKRGGNQLFRNAYALMLNTGVSAVLGLGYWLVAARYYSEDAVGQGSAAIAAMKFLAGLTAVTLTGALARFIPVSGRRTGRLIFGTYAGSSAIVAFAAAVFLLTLDFWGPSYRFLHGTVNGLGFIAAVVGWSLLTLQDGVLTGLRKAVWVPVGNTVFSAAKLALLVGIAAAVPTAGVFVSWVAAIGLSVVPLGWLVFRRLAPRHAKATPETAEPPTARQMGRFVAGDATGSFFALAVVYLVPVMVASQISSTDNAYFYITMTIGGTIDLLAINMGSSLTVEGAHDPSRIAENCRAALRRMAKIMVPITLFMGVFAPQILGVFGEGYAQEGAPLLRLLALCSLTRVLIEVYFGILRAQSRTGLLAFLQGVLCLLVLGLTLALLGPLGITGAGWAELGSLVVIAVVAVVGLRRLVTAPAAGPQPAPAPAAEAYEASTAEPAAEQTAAAGEDLEIVYGTRWARAAALDSDTLQLGVHLDFDHPERRPYVTPPQGTAIPELPAPRAEKSLTPATAPAAPDPAPDPPAPAPAETPAETSAEQASEAPAPPGAPAGRRTRLLELGVWVLLVGALTLYWLPLSRMDDASLDAMNGLGLISVLPPATLAGAALLVVAFAAGLWLRAPRRWLLLAILLATVVSLHGVPALLEEQPRFATAWQHAGFIDYIGRTGDAAPDMDARFSWPGFFAAVTFVTRAIGLTDLTEVLRWWPLAVELLYLAPLMLLLRAVRAGWRAKWCAVWMFALCGWVGQDYFSPQSLNYLIYLLFAAVLLVWFRAPGAPRGTFLPGEAEVPPTGRTDRAVLLALLVALFAASVVSHQLTPFVMLGVLAVLVLVRRSTPLGLPLLCGVLLIGWICYLAEPYWSGHFDELFGGVGSLGGNVSSSVSGRIEGGSTVHKLVLYVRIALAGGVMVLAAAGWLRRRWAGINDRALLVLLVVPFLGFGMQSYGGEMALRVFLFALPGAAVLGALAFFPRSSSDRGWRGPAAALLAGWVLMAGFLVARWGNEPFERVRTGEVAAMEYVYAHDKPTARLVWLSTDPVNDVTPSLPWNARDMERVTYVPVLAPRDPVLVDPLVKALQDAGPNSYLMVSRGQDAYLQLDAGFSRTWPDKLLRSLDGRTELRPVVRNEDATVYALREQPAGWAAAQPRPGRVFPVVTWNTWTAAGVLAGVSLLVLLGARELVRVTVPEARRRRGMRWSLVAAAPLLLVFLAATAVRFLTLS